MLTLFWKQVFFSHVNLIEHYFPPLLGRAVSSGCHPVPTHCFLARNGVWYRDRAAEKDTGLCFDITPQFGTVFPEDQRVLTSGGEL